MTAICETVLLASALAGLSPNTCALVCRPPPNAVVTQTNGTWYAAWERGAWHKVLPLGEGTGVDRFYLLVAKQLPEQCRDGGVSR